MIAGSPIISVIADAAIGIACIVVGGTLSVLTIRRSGSLNQPVLVALISFFTVACGLAFLVGIGAELNEHSLFHSVVKVISAAALVVVAVGVVAALPGWLDMNHSTQWVEEKEKLQQEIQGLKHAQRESMRLQSDLASYGMLANSGQLSIYLANRINQPLLAIVASADTAIRVAKTAPATDPLIFECLDDIQRDTFRAGEIMRKVRQSVLNEKSPLSTVDVKKLVDEVVQRVSSDASKADIELIVKTQKTPFIKANSVQIAQALVILLCNAVQVIAASSVQGFNNQKNRVTIESAYDGTDVTVSVKDSGLDEVYDSFTVFDPETVDSMGIAISTSREILEAHGGELRFSSNDPAGASFTFNLPALSA